MYFFARKICYDVSFFNLMFYFALPDLLLPMSNVKR